MYSKVIQGEMLIEKNLITEKMYEGVNNKKHIRSIQKMHKGKIYYKVLEAMELMERIKDNLDYLLDELRAESATMQNPPFNKFDYQEEFKRQRAEEMEERENRDIDDLLKGIFCITDSYKSTSPKSSNITNKPTMKDNKKEGIYLFGNGESNEWDVKGENILIGDLCKYLVSKNREAADEYDDIPTIKLGDRKLRQIMEKFGFISSKPIGNGRNRYIPSNTMVNKGYMMLKKYDIKIAGMDKKKVSYTLKITPVGVNYFVKFFNKHPEEFVEG